MMFKTLSGCCQEALRRHNGRSEDAQRTLIKKGKNPINFKWHFSNLKLTRVTLENRKMHVCILVRQPIRASLLTHVMFLPIGNQQTISPPFIHLHKIPSCWFILPKGLS